MREEMAGWKKITKIREEDEAERKRLDDESEHLRKEKARLKNKEEEKEWEGQQKMIEENGKPSGEKQSGRKSRTGRG